MSGEEKSLAESRTAGSTTPWIDPDDSPEWTDEMFDRAEGRKGDRLIRRGRRRDEDDTSRSERV